MKDPIAREKRYLERACAAWDWARAAGVSAEELRKALTDEAKARCNGACKRLTVAVLPEAKSG